MYQLSTLPLEVLEKVVLQLESFKDVTAMVCLAKAFPFNNASFLWKKLLVLWFKASYTELAEVERFIERSWHREFIERWRLWKNLIKSNWWELSWPRSQSPPPLTLEWLPSAKPLLLASSQDASTLHCKALSFACTEPVVIQSAQHAMPLPFGACNSSYFEVTVQKVHDRSKLSIGWAPKGFCSAKVGLIRNTFGFNWENGRVNIETCVALSTTIDRPLAEGSTLGCLLRMDTGDIAFIYNGSTIFQKTIDLSDMESALHPTISVGSKTELSINYGGSQFTYALEACDGCSAAAHEWTYFAARNASRPILEDFVDSDYLRVFPEVTKYFLGDPSSNTKKIDNLRNCPYPVNTVALSAQRVAMESLQTLLDKSVAASDILTELKELNSGLPEAWKLEAEAPTEALLEGLRSRLVAGALVNHVKIMAHYINEASIVPRTRVERSFRRSLKLELFLSQELPDDHPLVESVLKSNYLRQIYDQPLDASKNQLVLAIQVKNMEDYRTLLDQNNWEPDLFAEDEGLDFEADIDPVALLDVLEGDLPDSDPKVVFALQRCLLDSNLKMGGLQLMPTLEEQRMNSLDYLKCQIERCYKRWNKRNKPAVHSLHSEILPLLAGGQLHRDKVALSERAWADLFAFYEACAQYGFEQRWNCRKLGRLAQIDPRRTPPSKILLAKPLPTQTNAPASRVSTRTILVGGSVCAALVVAGYASLRYLSRNSVSNSRPGKPV